MDSWTVKRLLEWTTDFFKQKGIESPRLESEILLSTAMHIKRIELYTNFAEEPSESQRADFRKFVQRRAAGEPVAYLVGFKEFFSLSLKVDSSVLIPRPETETLVLETLDYIKRAGPELHICDVGTGSGAIVIAVAKNLPAEFNQTRLSAVDISPGAMALAQENAQRLGVEDRITFSVSDLLENVQGPLDLIVSNPPYVSESEYEALPVDVQKYEPRLALLAGPKGTEIIERLIHQAAEKLRPDGFLLLEGSPMIADQIKQLLQGWKQVRIIKDHAGLERFALAQR